MSTAPPSPPSPGLKYAPPPTARADWCLFLDVDGTLLELTDTPSHTVADETIKDLLSGAAQRLQGALALVSGRRIATLDELFAPLRLPAAGLHGLERRDASGRLHGVRSGAALDPLRNELRELAAAHPGVLIEDKSLTIAVHYRLAPQAENLVRQRVMALCQGLGAAYHVQHGKMMCEIKPRSVTKGTAVEQFMGEQPFAGRTPVFIGDDLTDNDGCAMADRLGGISIGVGDTVSARYRLRDVDAVHGWLHSIATLS